MSDLENLTTQFEEKIIHARQNCPTMIDKILFVDNVMLEAVTYERTERGLNNEISLEQICLIDAGATGADWSHKFALRCAFLALDMD
jgi:hypothetical protein